MHRLLLPFVLCVLLSSMQAQWVQTNGPFGGNVQALASLGPDLFAGTLTAGVFRSTDMGISWVSVNTGLMSLEINALVATDSNLFAGTEYEGVFLSTNRGVSWNTVNNGLIGREIHDMAANATHLFAAALGGVSRSTDNGDTWTQGSQKYGIVERVAINGSTLLGSVASGVIVSTDEGATWGDLELAPDRGNAFAFMDTTIFAASSTGGHTGHVYKSTDNGTTWQERSNGLPKALFYSLAVKDTMLFVGGSEGVYRSSDKGETWMSVNDGIVDVAPYASHSWVNKILVHGSSLFLGTNGKGAMRSTDNGVRWSVTNTNLINTNGFEFGFSDTAVFVFTFGLYTSGNSGADWSEVNVSNVVNKISVFAMSGKTLFAASKDTLIRSIDDGRSWTALSQQFGFKDYISAVAGNGTDMYVGLGNRMIYRSRDNGTTWELVLPATWQDRVVAIAIAGNHVFASTAEGAVMHSKDGGTSWDPIANTFGNTPMQKLVIVGPYLFASSGDYILRSADNAATWISVRQNLPALPVAMCVSGTNLFAATYRDGIFLSTDYGASWNSISEGLPSLLIIALGASDTEVFAGTYGAGVWKRPKHEVISSVRDAEASLTPRIHIEQNRPNPVRTSTAVSFSLHQSGQVLLRILDARGVGVMTLVSEHREAGPNTISWDASSVASGVYFLQLQSDGQTKTQLVVVLH